jgi:hypothetical protein
MRQLPRTRILLAALLAATAALCIAQANNDTLPGLSLTTPDRLQEPGWWPTKGEPAASAYTGEAACLQCHAGIAATQHETPMYHAAGRPAQSTILAQHPSLTFHEGPYTETIRQTSTGTVFTVNNETAKPIAWAIGQGEGEVGQTYLLKDHDQYTESRISYYTALHAADLTTGQSAETPSSLQNAFGQVLKTDAAQHCFSCHTTHAVIAGNFNPDHAIPGITCEACHGPGAKHVAAMTAGRLDQAAATITNPANMSPTDSVDFCGACHRTASDVNLLLPPNMGIVVARFQPYRLEKSRCWAQSGDARITCIACHDPHKPLIRDLAAYDKKCLACHQGSGINKASQLHATAPACKIATKNCASCHMPKYEISQTHAKFTDHDIRVVKAGETFPQ